MLQLVANGPEEGQTFKRALPDGAPVRLGRAPQTGWAVSWDPYISREHADLRVVGDRLEVNCLGEATNPAYVNGQPARQLTVSVGEKFRIGKTIFTLARIVEVEIPPIESVLERTFDRLVLKNHQFQNADQRLEVLCDLPAVISLATTEQEFGQGLVRLLLEGIPHASAAAVVLFDVASDPEMKEPARVFWDGRGTSNVRFRPSQRLMKGAIEGGETTLYVWGGKNLTNDSYTVTADLDWAFCTPIQEPACRGWCLYVSGRLTSGIKSADDLTGDIRFAELIAQTAGAIRRLRSLEQQQAGLRQFFSPAVMATLAAGDANQVLAPSVRDITVLFCDIRGFARKAEETADNLTELLRRTSEALGLMTREIIVRDGVVADFQGDAALAFWGWPMTSEDGPLPACRAALAIQAELQRVEHSKEHPLAGFRVGIGIAHGQAIAGKIGAPEQAKVGVLGPVVNLGARLETMTKQLGASILVDEATANWVRAKLSPSEGRCRRMGRVRPYGLSSGLEVSQLLPRADADERFTAEAIADFEAAVSAVEAGEWAKALELLENVPGPDRAKDFLTVFIAQNNYEPPKDWDGTIQLPRK